MSRASELTLFLILLQASIGFVDGSGIFSESYMDVPENNASYTITDLETYTAQTKEENSITSQIDLYLDWAWDAFFIGLKIVGAVIFVLPTLADLFGMDATNPLLIFIQVGVYYVYATWYTQYKSGRGWKQYE